MARVKARQAGPGNILATQQPDAKSLPTGVSANVSLRFCLKVIGQLENDMILGTSAYKNGIGATTFRPEVEAGLGYLAGRGRRRCLARTTWTWPRQRGRSPGPRCAKPRAPCPSSRSARRTARRALVMILIILGCTIALAAIGGIAWLVHQAHQDRPGRPVAARAAYQLPPKCGRAWRFI